jgi:hypothetical protein
MNARTAEEQRALEAPLLPMPMEDYLRELGDLKLWRQEIADQHPEARIPDLPASVASASLRLDRVIAQLSKVLVA